MKTSWHLHVCEDGLVHWLAAFSRWYSVRKLSSVYLRDDPERTLAPWLFRNAVAGIFDRRH